MKKNIIYSILTISLVLGAANISLADGMPYEPVFESEPITESTAVTTTASSINLFISIDMTNSFTS